MRFAAKIVVTLRSRYPLRGIYADYCCGALSAVTDGPSLGCRNSDWPADELLAAGCGSGAGIGSGPAGIFHHGMEAGVGAIGAFVITGIPTGR
jgi:hypothetical protein